MRAAMDLIAAMRRCEPLFQNGKSQYGPLESDLIRDVSAVYFAATNVLAALGVQPALPLPPTPVRSDH